MATGRDASLYDALRMYQHEQVTIYLTPRGGPHPSVVGTLTYVDDVCCVVWGTRTESEQRRAIPTYRVVPFSSIHWVQVNLEPDEAAGSDAP